MNDARQVRGVGQVAIMQAELGIGLVRILVYVVDMRLVVEVDASDCTGKSSGRVGLRR